ncbi:hypothetical protein [Butyrivibrio sp. AC2005]|uniref:hypothetical protein n=1 Tax=Butyrivibrio sp. AC2005 TaxID=1280672 RepID=UPI00047D21C6|nr:hypothetical protein [Butyrivibrio sp. AC2005]
MSKSLRRRLQALRMDLGSAEDVGAILKLIDSGAYYDELTEEEKDAYCRYLGSKRDGYEELYCYVNGDLHFKLEYRQKPASQSEFLKNVKEVSEIMDAYTRQYNSPEEKAKRDADYHELVNKGKLFKAKCHETTTSTRV